MDRCWADKYCKGFPKLCNQFCDGYVILEILYKQSNIPKKYQYAQDLTIDRDDAGVYQAVSDIINGNVIEWVNKGNSLLLWGENKGNGKTSLACAIANKYIRDIASNKAQLDPVVYFIKSAKFLEEMRQQFNHPTVDFPTTLEIIENVPLLIIDDIGAEKPTDWVRERLLNIIDERYSNNRSIIYTSNCNLKEIEMNLHGRIADRIRESRMLEFKGVSKRGLYNE